MILEQIPNCPYCTQVRGSRPSASTSAEATQPRGHGPSKPVAGGASSLADVRTALNNFVHGKDNNVGFQELVSGPSGAFLRLGYIAEQR